MLSTRGLGVAAMLLAVQCGDAFLPLTANRRMVTPGQSSVVGTQSQTLVDPTATAATTARPGGVMGYSRSRRASVRRGAVSMEADFYADLGVSRSADESELKRAFRKKAKTCHPDVNDTEEGKVEWAKISRAYEVLSDPQQKQRYDTFGEAGVTSAAGSPGGGAGQQVDLSDIFDSFFGGGGGFGGPAGGPRRRGPVKGDDLRFDLEVDFQMGAFGGKEKIRIRHLETCEVCDGDGVKPGTKKRQCGTCGGSGVVSQVTRTPLGSFQTQGACPTCRGEGVVIDEYCPKCSGQGVNQVSKQVTLTVPAGVETGNKLRVRGEGDASPSGGPPGDLYIFVKVKEDKNFRREGMEIYSDISVPYIDAVLGAEYSVKTIDGEVNIKIPAGSQPETVLRMKGHGAPKLGDVKNRGNHYVTLKVKIPENLSKRERELFEELKTLQKQRA